MMVTDRVEVFSSRTILALQYLKELAVSVCTNLIGLDLVVSLRVHESFYILGSPRDRLFTSSTRLPFCTASSASILYSRFSYSA